MSQRSRGEYFRAIYAHYRQGDRKLKQVILNEFCANTGTTGSTRSGSGSPHFPFLP
jgi:hypothetical protein